MTTAEFAQCGISGDHSPHGQDPMRCPGRRYADERASDVAWMTAAERAELDVRRELCEAHNVTLDGKPACISGTRSPFATVTVLPDGPSCGWAWPTVGRIAGAGGAFKS